MPTQLTYDHKRKAKMHAARLRRYAEAVVGKSELKVGPASIAALMNDAAKLFEQMVVSEKWLLRKDEKYMALHPGRYFIRHGGILVTRDFITRAAAEDWARENYGNATSWALVSPERQPQTGNP